MHAIVFGAWILFIIGSVSVGICRGECYLPLATPFVLILLAVTFIIGSVFKHLLEFQSKKLKIFIFLLPPIIAWFLIVIMVRNSTTLSQTSCDFVGEGSTQNQSNCYYKLATKNLDFSTCFKIPAGQYFGGCANKLWLYVKEVDIPSICSREISGRQSDLCYWDIAARKENSNLCSYMSDSQLKQNCANFVAQYPGRTLDK
jgi:cytochrome c oxidase subunit IV